MAELDSVISEVCQCLEEGGVSAVISQNPFGGKKRHLQPIVTVGLKAGSAVSCGLNEYIGRVYDETTDSYDELYGKKIDLSLSLSMWSPKRLEQGHEKCLLLFSQIVNALNSLPQSLKVRELNCGETRYDPTAEMFRCDAVLVLAAYFVAERTDDTSFLDFKLKGVLTN